MGKTAFAGPLYGAKCLLWSPFVPVVSSGTTTQTIARTIVPTYEDWYITEAVYQCSSGSTGAVLASSVASYVIKDDGSSMHVASVLASITTPTLVTLTPDAGEFEGRRVAGGSTLAFVVRAGDSAVPLGTVRGEFRGFIRFISSSRSE